MSAPATYLEALDQGIVNKRLERDPRGHLGWSEVGNEDERKLWLNFRWCFPEITDPRVLRIFDNGVMVEDMLAKWTRDAGLHLVTLGPDGQQFHFERLGGHLGGHMDGAIFGAPEHPGEWLVWEAKSANDNRFKALKKVSGKKTAAAEWQRMEFEDLRRVGLKEWSPEYWGQVQGYMGESGMRRALVVIYDKNRSEIHPEFVEFDELAYQGLVSKAERIITADRPPAPLYDRLTDWRAKIVMNQEERDVYFAQRLPPTANCRNCRFSTPVIDQAGAQWHCGRNNSLIGPPERQRAGCEKHQFIPELMPADLLVVDDAIARYRTPEGHEFTNCGLTPGGFASAELIELAKDEFAMLGDAFFLESRRQLGARVMSPSEVANKGLAELADISKKTEELNASNAKYWNPFPDDDIPF